MAHWVIRLLYVAAALNGDWLTLANYSLFSNFVTVMSGTGKRYKSDSHTWYSLLDGDQGASQMRKLWQLPPLHCDCLRLSLYPMGNSGWVVSSSQPSGEIGGSCSKAFMPTLQRTQLWPLSTLRGEQKKTGRRKQQTQGSIVGAPHRAKIEMRSTNSLDTDLCFLFADLIWSSNYNVLSMAGVYFDVTEHLNLSSFIFSVRNGTEIDLFI